MITRTRTWKPVIGILLFLLLCAGSVQLCLLIGSDVTNVTSTSSPVSGCVYSPDCSFEVCNGTNQFCERSEPCRISRPGDTLTFCPGWRSNNCSVFINTCPQHTGSCASNTQSYHDCSLSTEWLCSAQDESKSLQFSFYFGSMQPPQLVTLSVTVISSNGTTCKWTQTNNINTGWHTVDIPMPAFTNYSINFSIPVTNYNNLAVAIDDIKLLPSKDRTCYLGTTETSLTSGSAPVTLTLSPATLTGNSTSTSLTSVTEVPSYSGTWPLTETLKTSNASTTQVVIPDSTAAPSQLRSTTKDLPTTGGDHFTSLIAAVAGGAGGGLIVVAVAVIVSCKIKKRMGKKRGNIANDGMNSFKRGEETPEVLEETRYASSLNSKEADVQRYSNIKPSTVVTPFYHNMAFHNDKQHHSDLEQNILQNESGERSSGMFEWEDSKNIAGGTGIEETKKRETDNISRRSSRRSKKKKGSRKVDASECTQYEDVDPNQYQSMNPTQYEEVQPAGTSELSFQENVGNDKTTSARLGEPTNSRSEKNEIQLSERPSNDSSKSDVYCVVNKHGKSRKNDRGDSVKSRRSMTEVEETSVTKPSTPHPGSDHSGQSGGTTRGAISIEFFCDTGVKTDEYSPSEQATTEDEHISDRHPAHGSNQETPEVTDPDDYYSVTTSQQPNNVNSSAVTTAWSNDVEQYNELSLGRPSEDHQVDNTYDHVNAIPDDMYATAGTEKRVVVIDDVYNHLN